MLIGRRLRTQGQAFEVPATPTQTELDAFWDANWMLRPGLSEAAWHLLARLFVPSAHRSGADGCHWAAGTAARLSRSRKASYSTGTNKYAVKTTPIMSRRQSLTLTCSRDILAFDVRHAKHLSRSAYVCLPCCYSEPLLLPCEAADQHTRVMFLHVVDQRLRSGHRQPTSASHKMRWREMAVSL